MAHQQGQIFELKAGGADGMRLWAYRYRVGGRGSRRVQRGGFVSEQAAAEALERALEQLRREQGLVGVSDAGRVRRGLPASARGRAGDDREASLAARQGGPGVRGAGTERASLAGARRLADDDPDRAPPRSNAGRSARSWRGRPAGDCSTSTRPSSESRTPSDATRRKRPFDSWEELYALAGRLGRRHGPMVLFAAATGLRPGEWLALEHRGIDGEAQVVYVRRTLRKGRVKTPKTKASVRAVPLQAIAFAALDQLPPNPRCQLVFPSVRGGYLDLHDFRTETGNRHSVRPGSRRCAGSTIYGTPSRPSRSVPPSRRSTSPATWARAWR